MSAPYNFTQQVAFKVLDLLTVKRAMLHTTGTLFYIWQRGDRIIVAFDPAAIDLKRVNEEFVHDLSTRLHGRLVVRTNSRGLFLQVGFDVPAAPMSLDAIPLNLTQQPGAWHMPVGVTKDGPLWISLMDADSMLVGGSRGGGKTGLVHGIIQALLAGAQTIIWATDGKQGVEFGPYMDKSHFHFYLDSVKMLEQLRVLMMERQRQLIQSGYPSIAMHNEALPDQFIMPIALIVDEAADLPDVAKDTLKTMIRLFRHLGLHPIIATNQPTVADVFSKTNLSTRIAFHVPHHNDSITMLGYKGADALPDIQGRGLIVWKGKFVQFQSFVVHYPMASEETRKLLTSQVDDPALQPALQPVDEIAQLADRIRDQWEPGLSGRAVGRLLGKSYGGSWKAKIDQVIDRLSATATTTPENLPDSGAVAA